jgi:hypothetical protein|tara:strand:+ start:396 stop:1094 length:699 start_codon:yes stop_codon:yes gene_type:complete
MNSLKFFETQKLHYGKYLYKLVLANPLSSIFRTELQKSGNLVYAKVKLDELNEKYNRGELLTKDVWRTTSVIEETAFLDALDIYNNLKSLDDYKIRIERGCVMWLYSNNKKVLLLLCNKMRSSAKEFWEPTFENVDFLKEEKNIVLVKSEPEFPLRVWLGYKKIDPALANWLANNQDKSSVGNKTLKNIKTGWCGGNYFYVRNEKILIMIELLVGHNIQRVEKLVYKPNIDK